MLFIHSIIQHTFTDYLLWATLVPDFGDTTVGRLVSQDSIELLYSLGKESLQFEQSLLLSMPKTPMLLTSLQHQGLILEKVMSNWKVNFREGGLHQAKEMMSVPGAVSPVWIP